MRASQYLGNRGQAAALDLAVFVAICILSLSYLFIQSIATSADMGFIQENENINEVAVRALNALAQSSGGDLEIVTVQPIALKPVNAPFSEDIRTIMRYADACIRILDDLEKDLRNGKAISLDSDNPYFIYLKSRISAVSDYLTQSQDLMDGLVSDFFSDAEKAIDVPCDAIRKLSDMLPGYDSVDAGCGSLDDGFLGDLVGGLSDAAGAINDFEGDLSTRLKELESAGRGLLADSIHALRCAISAAKDAANSLLNYLETGLNTEVSFLELFPVRAKVRGMTIERLLADAVKVGNSFAFTDDMRAAAAAAGLLLVRDKNINNSFDFSIPDGGMVSTDGVKNVTEDLAMRPKPPLSGVTNTTSEGPYGKFLFGSGAYVTNSGYLGIRLSFLGDEVGGLKQKSEYFEGMDYVLNSSGYTTREHRRTYNGSFVKGVVSESRITQTARSWTETARPTPEINATSTVTEYRLVRPMRAQARLEYGNLSWPDETYDFDIEQYRVVRDSIYLINLSQKDFDYNKSDALKSIALGILLSGRGGLYGLLESAIKERLDELLGGYSYKFEAWDCCRRIIAINMGAEPAGRRGLSRRYFNGGGQRGYMALTVWRE
jgi:hypothetical protein